MMNGAEIGTEVWSGIKTLGSLGGLVSAAFLLWDRATKSQPYARFLREDGSDIYEKNRVILRVFNPSNRLMLAQVDISDHPQNLYLSADDETFERAGRNAIMPIKPNGFVDLDVMRQDGWKTLSCNELINSPILASFLKVFRCGPLHNVDGHEVAARVDKPRKEEAAGVRDQPMGKVL